MRINIELVRRPSFRSLSMSTNRLPEPIIEQLVSNRKFWRDLPRRLALLPVVHKARYIGIYPENTPHENALKYSKLHGTPLCVGYIIWKEDDSPWKLEPYSFCVRPEDERVIDPTAGHDWSKMKVHYLGFKVPKKDIPNMKYLHRFEHMSYLLEHL